MDRPSEKWKVSWVNDGNRVAVRVDTKKSDDLAEPKIYKFIPHQIPNINYREVILLQVLYSTYCKYIHKLDCNKIQFC